MTRFLKGFGLVAVVLLTRILPVSAADPESNLVSQAFSPQGEPGSSVTIRVFQFQPGQLEVKPGSQVTWTNQDDIEHTVTSGTPEKPDGRFNTRMPGKGATFNFAFTQPGTYTYFCNRHQSMRGQVRVN